ncbi:AbrB/MazE/SpoVT family DNA-binding domain-containing protein [Thermoplasmatales archaeon AK]|nr:AbrB/MazE/SpoVT family DNA-binding domain-containing protein [Thermoplasmatales archaeon AK]
MKSYTRRLQLTGGSTYILSLPSKWIKENSLGKGSEVTVEQKGKDLVIAVPGTSRREKSKTLFLREQDIDSEDLLRVLTSIYISDFHTLTISSNKYISQETRDLVRKFSRFIMGVEIFEETSRSIVLQNVLDSSTFPLSYALRRMSLNVETMIEDTRTALMEHSTSLMENVISRDDEVDRYQLYVYREVRSRASDDVNAVYYLIFSRILERIADHSVNICRMWISRSDQESSSPVDLINFIDRVREMYNEASEAFYSEKLDMINQIIGKKGMIRATKEEIIKKFGASPLSYLIISCAEEALRIGLYATDIAELALDKIIGSTEEFSI